MAEDRPSRLVPVILIVVVVVAAGLGAGLLYEVSHPKPTAPVQTVGIGSNVTVNYIGYIGSGPQTGRVFDTSLVSVALNNVSYPKTVEFTLRSPLSEYSPLAVSVGSNVPAGGYSIDNLTFGAVVPGFWQGLLGLPVNQSRTITIPPSLGYGPLDPACLTTYSLTTSVPVVSVVPAQNFSTVYPNVTASAGTRFVAAPYNWTALVLSVNATAVTVENLPTLGQSVVSSGLPATVSAINQSAITVRITVGPTNVGLIAGRSAGTVCGSTQFLVSGLNLTAGTYTANYNHEVVGSTLFFTVTVVKFY
ncbi:MAG TPA: FKBP-type peptidyl-prolyl cis-trans isomerase [Thermoplasmata archaeon]|nr:FKBP-type peptidyl-prolyl cis-trans isomerase [Thermoplasmata archaeon]